MKYRCSVCGYIYDEETGINNTGTLTGTQWGHLPNQWVCPKCRTPKSKFTLLQSVIKLPMKTGESKFINIVIEDVKQQEKTYQMSYGELSALCSGLANSCRIQYLFHEAELFTILADYYKSHTGQTADVSVNKLISLIDDDQSKLFPLADDAADAVNDRGAKRIIRWTKGATRSLNSNLERYKSQGDALLQNSNVYICEICGYIHIGDKKPEICPVCRVSDVRISKVI